LRTRIEALGNFMTLSFSSLWVPLLKEIVNQCIDAFEGKVDRDFWKSICKFKAVYGSGGGTYISGWVNNLFPSNRTYLCSWKEIASRIEKSKRYGRDIEDFSETFCEAPVIWNFLGKEIPMNLKAGFIGPVLLNEKTLTPQITWVLLRSK